MPRVAVIGAVNADYIVRVGRLPQPGETVTGGRLSIRPGGKGANQAHAAARLGADVLLVASVGTDRAADAERDALAADGIDTSGLAACARIPQDLRARLTPLRSRMQFPRLYAEPGREPPAWLPQSRPAALSRGR